MRALVVCSLVLIACGGEVDGDRSGGSTPPTARPAERLGSDLSWPADAPPRAACTEDGDCLVVPASPDPDDPCCDVTVTASSVSKRFLEYAKALRSKSCVEVKCPPLSLPGARLAECGYRARCIDGRCGNACETSESQ